MIMTVLAADPPSGPRKSKSKRGKVIAKGPLAPAAVPHTNGTSHLGTNTNPKELTLLAKFIEAHKEIESYKSGKAVVVDGYTLSIAAVTAAARYNAPVTLKGSPEIKDRVLKSRRVIEDKMKCETSVYGVSTGFGGSADTRTDDTLALGMALLQHQHSGILPTSSSPSILPLLDPLASTSMPESWVRGAILIRMNSLIRGHSGVRWELVEKMGQLLEKDVVPLVPMRGSISASGDLSPLSYIAGTLIGNPAIRAFCGPRSSSPRQILPSPLALSTHSITPISLQSKEHLGILNGTAFSASVASLALNDAVHLSMLGVVCTAMGVEALLGERGSFDRFIHKVARPHPGQVEAAEHIWNLLEGSKLAATDDHECSIAEDEGVLRQDRYPLRTAPQFIGPQIEDILAALGTVTQECNSTTDNPLIDSTTSRIHHGGNFQAMSITNSMEKTRLSLHHIGKLLFAQCTEICNPSMNRGLPPSLAATDPSLNYAMKGVDIAVAAYVGELGWLAGNVSTHVQSAEMHNQAVNSLALISARATINALEVLSLLISSYLYALCQALDLRALQSEFLEGMAAIAREELDSAFGPVLKGDDGVKTTRKVLKAMREVFDETSTMDVESRMEKVVASSSTILVDFLSSGASTKLADPITTAPASMITSIPTFRSKVASRCAHLLQSLRSSYLSGEKGPAPASPFLGRTKGVYEFVRVGLGIEMHGRENLTRFEGGLGAEEVSVGGNISRIYEAIRDGKMQSVVVSLFE